MLLSAAMGKNASSRRATDWFRHKPLTFFLIFAIPEKSGFRGITVSIAHKILPAS